jgi:flagellar biosynthesis/type III secretory pathway protein FliH
MSTNKVSNAQEKAARDRRWMISGARMDGREEGLREGREEGRREGIELGRLISVVQYQQSILGLPESTLSELCNLSAKDLNELAEHLLATIRSRT